MLQAERKRFILNLLEKEESLTIKRLADACEVSEITARRDLDDLSGKGLIIRTHGGAVRHNTSSRLLSYSDKANKNREEKIRICNRAATYIQEGDIIYIDCGSTVFHLTRFITHFKNLKVITNSLPIASELIHFPNIRFFNWWRT